MKISTKMSSNILSRRLTGEIPRLHRLLESDVGERQHILKYIPLSLVFRRAKKQGDTGSTAIQVASSEGKAVSLTPRLHFHIQLHHSLACMTKTSSARKPVQSGRQKEVITNQVVDHLNEKPNDTILIDGRNKDVLAGRLLIRWSNANNQTTLGNEIRGSTPPVLFQTINTAKKKVVMPQLHFRVPSASNQKRSQSRPMVRFQFTAGLPFNRQRVRSPHVDNFPNEPNIRFRKNPRLYSNGDSMIGYVSEVPGVPANIGFNSIVSEKFENVFGPVTRMLRTTSRRWSRLNLAHQTNTMIDDNTITALRRAKATPIGHQNNSVQRAVAPVDIRYKTDNPATQVAPKVAESAPVTQQVQAKIDINQLTRDVMQQIEKRIRVERQRHGLL
jgi:hypothetical protein